MSTFLIILMMSLNRPSKRSVFEKSTAFIWLTSWQAKDTRDILFSVFKHDIDSGKDSVLCSIKRLWKAISHLETIMRLVHLSELQYPPGCSPAQFAQLQCFVWGHLVSSERGWETYLLCPLHTNLNIISISIFKNLWSYFFLWCWH